MERIRFNKMHHSSKLRKYIIAMTFTMSWRAYLRGVKNEL